MTDVVSDYAVVYGYWADGETAYFAVAATVLLASSVANAVIASSALYPAIDGLDLGSMEEAHAKQKQLPRTLHPNQSGGC